MEVLRRGFQEIISDNDEVFLQHLIGVVDSVDELSHVEVSKTPHSLHCRVAPSTPDYLEPILYEVLKLSNLFKIRLELSKSMKASSTVTFDIPIETN